MPDTPFFERSRRVSQAFLQSAVVVDDLARLGGERSRRDEQPTKLQPPGRGSQRSSKKESDAEEQRAERDAATHDLDAKLLIDAFADKGIVCAALRPELQENEAATEGADGGEHADDIEDVTIRTDRATQRADIVVLDWNISPETSPGRNALTLIRQILNSDVASPDTPGGAESIRRLRLIAIYTGESELKPIVDEIADFAKDLNLTEENVEIDDFSVRAGAVTFVVYGKDKGVTESDAPHRRVDEESLPERLLNDFTTMTSGLLSNVALASLSAVRLNTHRILSRFDYHMDAPYVAHRAMMEPPDEASEHPVPLVAEEIESILADASIIRQHVGEEALQEWLESLEGVPLGEGMNMSRPEFKGRLVDLLTNGLNSQTMTAATPQDWKDLIEDLKHYREREAASRLSNELTREGLAGEEADAEFAMLTSTKSQYDEPKPYLRLGTVVAYNRNGGRWKYRLCVQPLCDSVRLSGRRNFPFLKLDLVEPDANRPFDLVVKDGKELKRLKVSLKAHHLEIFKMGHDPDKQVVLATEQGGDWIFETRDNNVDHLRWIGDLKTDFAHRVANMFASEISRVGLTESEWLRRMNMRYDPKPKVQDPESGEQAG